MPKPAELPTACQRPCMVTPAGGAPPVLRKRAIAASRLSGLIVQLTMNNIGHLLLRIGTGFHARTWLAPRPWPRGGLQVRPGWLAAESPMEGIAAPRDSCTTADPVQVIVRGGGQWLVSPAKHGQRSQRRA